MDWPVRLSNEERMVEGITLTLVWQVALEVSLALQPDRELMKIMSVGALECDS